MKNKFGFLFLAITLCFCALPVQGADYATFESFYSSGGIGFWGWTGIIVGTIAVAAFTYITFGGGAAAAPAWMTAVGGWIGSTVGLSGIAASNFGLALLGGGSIAAGGLGVAGGVAVLAAALSFGTDVAISYGTDIALESWNQTRFINANKEMIMLPIPRNEKGGKAYKAAIEYLNEYFKEDKLINDPENQSVVNSALGLLQGKMSAEKDKDYILKNDVLLALLKLQTNDYSGAAYAANRAMLEAREQKEVESLPAFIYALASLSNPETTCDDGIIYALHKAYVLEPKNKMIPIMTGCCMDRIMYRYHYGKITSTHLKEYFETITNEELNDELAAESLNIFLTRCLIELKRTKQDFYIITKDESLMNDDDIVAELKKRYDRHVSLISLLQTSACSQVTRLSKKFPKDSELTAEKLTSLLDSYWRDLPDLKDQITPKSNTQIPNYQQNGQNNPYMQQPQNGQKNLIFQMNPYGQNNPYMQQNPYGQNNAYMQIIPRTPQEQFQMGLRYAEGNGVPKSEAEAFRWWRRAADQGNADAQNMMGNCCFDGYGVERNYSYAVGWYRLAVEQGHAEAMYHLGACYYFGYGVTRNATEAVNWYRRAAEKGNESAIRVLNGTQNRNYGSSRSSQSNGDTVSRIQNMFPREYQEAQRLRISDPAAYRNRMYELQSRLNNVR